MPSLEELIRRFDDNSDIQRFDEAQLKQAVILPVLASLGWDPFDAQEIRPEFPVNMNNERVDFALLGSKGPLVLLEVKRPSEQLDSHQEQLLKYAFHTGVELAVLTNGVSWWFFLPLAKGSWEERRFYAIELYDQSSDDVLGRFNEFLGKPAVHSGAALEKAKKVRTSARRSKVIEGALPLAWEKMLRELDEDFVDLLASETEKICGVKPSAEDVERFVGGLAIGTDGSAPDASGKAFQGRASSVSKRTPGKAALRSTAGDHTFKRITGFKLGHQEFRVRTWREMHVKVCELLVKQHPERKSALLTLRGRKRDYFSIDEGSLYTPRPIPGTNIFAETNLSANNMVQVTEMVLKVFGIHRGQLHFVGE